MVLKDAWKVLKEKADEGAEGYEKSAEKKANEGAERCEEGAEGKC